MDVAAVSPADTGATSAPDGNPWALLGDAGFGGGPLQLSLAVSGGEDRICGDCAIATANVTGGTTPYHYTWSDPALTGPGPHEVCYPESRSLTLSVSDSSLAGPDDPSPAAMMQTASTTLSCTKAKSDSGTELSGCKLLLDASILSVLNPNGPYVERVFGCPKLEGEARIPYDQFNAYVDASAEAPTFAGQGWEVPEGLRAGKRYQLVFELLFPITLGGSVQMELWGTREGCGLDEALSRVTLLGIDRQSWCFTPQHDYDKLVVKTVDGSVPPIFAVSFGVSSTVCSGCVEARAPTFEARESAREPTKPAP